MELPIVIWNHTHDLYRIYREPTEEDTLLKEHIDDGTGTLTVKRRGRNVAPAHHHTYILFDENDSISKVFKCHQITTEGEGLTATTKYKFRELADERHIAALEEKINTRLEALEQSSLITHATLAAEQSNATGAGLLTKILFREEGNADAWTDGTILLPQGIYRANIELHCTGVNSGSNHLTIQAVYSNNAVPVSDTTKVYIQDSDKLVPDGTTDWYETREFILNLPHEFNKVEFQLAINGYVSNTTDIAADTACYIFRT